MYLSFGGSGWQSIECTTELARELLQSLERSGRIESLCVQLERSERSVTARTTATVLFGGAGVRGTVCAQEKARVTAHCGRNQRSEETA